MANIPAEARRTRSVWGIFLGICLMGFVMICALVALVSLAPGSRGVTKSLSNDRIAVISVTGVIASSGESSLFGVTPGAGQVISHIRSAARDKSVKAVIIRINSPGGSAAASQEIYEAVMAARRETRKPFLASMADVAASGGYYVAAGCDRIMANRATTTGSIGVIMGTYNLKGLFEWVRVEPVTIKSGKFKDMGSPNRSLTPEERQLLQNVVNSIYEQFVADVARGRPNLKPEQLRPYADGRVMTGEQAKKIGLVDDLGTFWDAVRLAQEMAKLPVSKTPNLKYYTGSSLLDQLLQARAPAHPGAALGLPAWSLAPLLLAPTAVMPQAVLP